MQWFKLQRKTHEHFLKEMEEIMNMPDEISQKAFDLYFYKNRKEISEKFQEEVLKFMKDTDKNLKGVL